MRFEMTKASSKPVQTTVEDTESKRAIASFSHYTNDIESVT